MLGVYSFDAVPVDAADESGDHDGALLGVATALATTSGPSGCGAAIAFDPAGTGDAAWIEIPDSPDWDLRRGSVELWVRPPAAGGFAAILSRDAVGTALSGHLALFIEPDGTVWARLQSPGITAYRCAELPLTAGAWHHVGINFGPPDFELWIDGADQTSATPLVSASGTDVRCGEARANFGIDGNDNPWIVGANGARAPEGTGTPVTDFFVGGAIDELRIAPFRRNF